LFAVLGTTYGVGDGSTTFGIPNLKGKVPVGRDSSDVAFDTIGETGGSKTSALVVANLPAHTHTASSPTTLPNGDLIVRQYGGGDAKLTANSDYGPYNAATITASTSTTVSGGGNGTATGDTFSNLQPYVVLNYIIRF
jgi:microcystin-dependent protein